MLSPEQKLIRAAMSFGAWQERARRTKVPDDRRKYMQAEVSLLLAAQELFETQKGSRDGKNGRNKS